jgi:hypothetical protein
MYKKLRDFDVLHEAPDSSQWPELTGTSNFFIGNIGVFFLPFQ